MLCESFGVGFVVTAIYLYTYTQICIYMYTHTLVYICILGGQKSFPFQINHSPEDVYTDCLYLYFHFST